MAKVRITRGKYRNTVGPYINGEIVYQVRGTVLTIPVDQRYVELVPDSTTDVVVEDGARMSPYKNSEAMAEYHRLAAGGFTDAKVDAYNERFKSGGYAIIKKSRGFLGRGVNYVLRRDN